MPSGADRPVLDRTDGRVIMVQPRGSQNAANQMNRSPGQPMEDLDGTRPRSPIPIRVPEQATHRRTFGKPATTKPQMKRRPTRIKRVLRFMLTGLQKCVGKNCCFFWLVLSIWGTIQLAVMSVLIYMRSVVLLEPSLAAKESVSIKHFDQILDRLSRTGYTNCMVAAIIYLLCGLGAYARIQYIKRQEARQPPPEDHLRRHKSYLMYDIGTRSDNKIRPRPTYY